MGSSSRRAPRQSMDKLGQLIDAGRLGQMVVKTGLDGFPAVLFVTIARQGHEADFLQISAFSRSVRATS